MGQRPRNNSIQLDGADLNDESTGGARGSLSMEAIQEFQVLTNGYQAEYGRASGGVVNAISKSGTNQFHGDVFGFLRQRDLDATNAFSPVKDPPYTRTQYGASLGGPIWRDHSFFFLAFEQLRRQESGFSQIGTNPATFSLTPEQEALKALDPTSPAIVAAERGLAIARDGIDPATGAPPDYPITPLGNLPGIYPVSQRLGTYSIRIDHALTPANRLALRFNYGHDRQSALEASNNDQIAGLLAPGRTARLTTLDPTAVLSLSSTFGPATINDARFSWAARQFEMNPNSRGTSVNIPGSAFLGREPILPHIRTERHWHIEDTMMLSRGPHGRLVQLRPGPRPRDQRGRSAAHPRPSLRLGPAAAVRSAVRQSQGPFRQDQHRAVHSGHVADHAPPQPTGTTSSRALVSATRWPATGNSRCGVPTGSSTTGC